MKKRKKLSIYYKTEMVKIDNKIIWRAVEMPSKLVLKESFFEEDVKKVVKFQNKHKTFSVFGFPPFFDCRTEQEKISDKGKSNYNPTRSTQRTSRK
jgi:tRNA1(Val) A37 N6-methylase TrmN6